MSDLERIIDSIIDQKVAPLQKKIEDLEEQIPTKEYLTAKDVQYVFSISRTTLWRFHNKKLIKKYLIGDKTLFKKSEIENIIQAY